MTLFLHLGVTEIPYSHQTGKNTGDIAEILEDKYHVIETFYDLHGAFIQDAVERSTAGALENLLLGGPGTLSFSAEAESEIENEFRTWLVARGMDYQVVGVPTKASLAGFSHRFKHPGGQRGSRPSFIDTGMYVTTYHVWTSYT